MPIHPGGDTCNSKPLITFNVSDPDAGDQVYASVYLGAPHPEH